MQMIFPVLFAVHLCLPPITRRWTAHRGLDCYRWRTTLMCPILIVLWSAPLWTGTFTCLQLVIPRIWQAMHGIRSVAFSLFWRCWVQPHPPDVYLTIRILLQIRNYFRRQLWSFLEGCPSLSARDGLYPDKEGKCLLTWNMELRLKIKWGLDHLGKHQEPSLVILPCLCNPWTYMLVSCSLWLLKWNDDIMNSI